MWQWPFAFFRSLADFTEMTKKISKFSQKIRNPKKTTESFQAVSDKWPKRLRDKRTGWQSVPGLLTLMLLTEPSGRRRRWRDNPIDIRRVHGRPTTDLHGGSESGGGQRHGTHQYRAGRTERRAATHYDAGDRGRRHDDSDWGQNDGERTFLACLCDLRKNAVQL